jgi:hypothetical protein
MQSGETWREDSIQRHALEVIEHGARQTDDTG